MPIRASPLFIKNVSTRASPVFVKEFADPGFICAQRKRAQHRQKFKQNQREATGGNGRGAEIDDRRDQREAQATGGNRRRADIDDRRDHQEAKATGGTRRGAENDAFFWGGRGVATSGLSRSGLRTIRE